MAAMDNIDTYCYFLEKRGYQRLGRGMLARVYGKPGSDLAVKVGAEYDSWPDYIVWAINQGFAGTYAPKVYALKYYSTFYVAIMERLVCTMNDLNDSNNYQPNYYSYLADELRCSIRYSHGTGQPGSLTAFARALGQTTLGNDLHGGNIMLRKDGQIVLTDPSSHISSNRLRIKNGQIIPHCN